MIFLCCHNLRDKNCSKKEKLGFVGCNVALDTIFEFGFVFEERNIRFCIIRLQKMRNIFISVQISNNGH